MIPITNRSVVAPRHTILSLLTLLSLVWYSPPAAQAALQPEQIALVVARGNKESAGLARYYCRMRGVPEQNLCEIDVPPGEVLDREQWQWAVRPEIRQWLAEHDPDGKLRCLVTTWGVPLKIARAPRDEASQRYLDHLQRERTSRLRVLGQVATLLEQLAGDDPAAKAPAPQAGDVQNKTSLAEVKKRLEQALQAAQSRIATLPEEERPAAAARLQQLATVTGGTQILLQGMAQQLAYAQAAGQSPPETLRERFDVLRGRVSAFKEVQEQLYVRPAEYMRDSLALTLLQNTGGQLAAVGWLEEQLATARKNETGASFDSELSLILEPDGYQLLRWQPNYLHASFEGTQLPLTFRTMMVSRLDAPTIQLAKGLIDTAIAVEQQGGLQGKIYLDARGLASRDERDHQPGSYPDYDRSLLLAADQLQALKNQAGEPRFEVILDEQPQLFQPGQCPEAALYCGWYSLAKYVDAFEWQPGAVAYHLASAEAKTLKEIDSQVWCKKLLEDGVCVTIGPVYEPYLIAFPRPDDFLEQLVQGKLTLVEAYYRTQLFNSWVMTLIGDPLYRPFPEE